MARHTPRAVPVATRARRLPRQSWPTAGRGERPPTPRPSDDAGCARAPLVAPAAGRSARGGRSHGRQGRRGRAGAARGGRPPSGRPRGGLEVDPAVVLEQHLGPGVGVVTVDLPLVVADRRPGKEPDGDARGEPFDTGKYGERSRELLAVARPRREQKARQLCISSRGQRPARSGPGGELVVEARRGQVGLDVERLFIRRRRCPRRPLRQDEQSELAQARAVAGRGAHWPLWRPG